MKNIAYRLWDYRYRKMHYKGFHISCDGELAFDPKVFIRGQYEPLDMEIQRGSGQMDREKKFRIFEGDIIEFDQLDPSSGTVGRYIAEVYYDYANAALRIRTKNGLKGFFPVNNARIIGNMMESPEKLI